jgi:DNA-directed RNA polymerase I, II, and III subunit RPABC1
MSEEIGEAGKELVRLWRVFRTVRQMLHDRGYQLLEDEVDISLDQFRDLYADPNTGYPDRKKMAFSLQPLPSYVDKFRKPQREGGPPPPEPEIGTVWVEFSGETGTVGIKQLRTFVQHIDQREFFTGILVTAASVSPSAAKIAGTIVPRQLEIFHESDLLVNITKHTLVPPHTLLSEVEKRELLDRYRLKETQLPRIQHVDPVAKYLGLRKGQVVKIVRKSATAGRYASYRLCV